MQPNIENFIGCDSSYRAASIVLYGAPYDSTTSYSPGARFGPAAIRHESYGLETYSPYQNAEFNELKKKTQKLVYTIPKVDKEFPAMLCNSVRNEME